MESPEKDSNYRLLNDLSLYSSLTELALEERIDLVNSLSVSCIEVGSPSLLSELLVIVLLIITGG